MYNIGIDIGGTKVFMGIVDEKGNTKSTLRIPTLFDGKESAEGAEKLIARISDGVRQLVSEANMSLDDINFIGAGFPGTVDTENGIITRCANLGMTNIDGGTLFKKHLGREVLLGHDSHTGALGELHFGAGRGMNNIVCITIGTGIGCGMIINKKIYQGRGYASGELGHVCIDPAGFLCGCGHRGCLERYTSGTGIFARAKQDIPAEKLEGRPQKTESVFDLAYEGDKDALSLIDRCLDDLSMGLAFIVSVLAPDGLFISGGLCVHDELVTKPLIEKTWNRCYPLAKDLGVVIAKAERGGEAPMLGASVLYLG